MSTHTATIIWKLGDTNFEYANYTRNHIWQFDNNLEVHASATPKFLGDAANIDPEEAYVASLASCHMLTFLAICAKYKIKALSYTDAAVGYLEKNEDNKLAITRVTLQPKIKFADDTEVTAEQLDKFHHAAHEHCFIASSVKTKIEVIS